MSNEKNNSAFNATRHGCCSSNVIIMKGENAEDYAALKKMWLASYNPKGEAERHLVHELIEANWFFKRATRKVAELEAFIFENDNNQNPLFWDDQHNTSLTRFLRYQTTRRRAYEAARKAVEDFRKCRAAEKTAEVKTVITQERHTIYKEKNKPEPSVQEMLAIIHKKAVENGYIPPGN